MYNRLQCPRLTFDARNIEKWLYTFYVAHLTNDVKLRQIVTKFVTLMELQIYSVNVMTGRALADNLSYDIWAYNIGTWMVFFLSEFEG